VNALVGFAGGPLPGSGLLGISQQQVRLLQHAFKLNVLGMYPGAPQLCVWGVCGFLWVHPGRSGCVCAPAAYDSHHRPRALPCTRVACCHSQASTSSHLACSTGDPGEPGSDCAGIVMASGPPAAPTEPALRTGQSMFGLVHGCLGSVAVADSRMLAPVPGEQLHAVLAHTPATRTSLKGTHTSLRAHTPALETALRLQDTSLKGAHTSLRGSVAVAGGCMPASAFQGRECAPQGGEHGLAAASQLARTLLPCAPPLAPCHPPAPPPHPAGNVTPEEAATLPTAFATAEAALAGVVALRAGETLLLHAGTGGVGLAALQVRLGGVCGIV